MIETLRWLIVTEVIGLAFLPLCMWLLRGLPDRGYAFSRVFGLVLTTFGVWLLASFFRTGTMIAVPIVIIAAAGIGGWWAWRCQALEAIHRARTAIAIEELLFLAVFVIWSLMRVYTFHSAISHTEQFMDMALLNTSLQSGSFPPQDLWMSGHTVNYYYLGYLMMATLTRLSGVAPAIGYNLALSVLYALVVSGAYGIGYALTRRYWWALLAPLFLAILGNWHAILVQIPQGQLTNTYWWAWAWPSTRVIGGAADYTINEFPYFSFMLGDLHPHVMALPVTLLAIALGLNVLLASESMLHGGRSLWARLGLTGICVGSLFTINSWDFPTYGLVIALCAFAGAYAADASPQWWKRPLVATAALGLVSILLFAPFYLHFRSLARGIGLVTTRTDLGDFLQIFGLFLLGVVLLIGSLALLLQPAGEVADETADSNETPLLTGEAGALDLQRADRSNVALAVVVLLALGMGIVVHAIVLVLLLLLAVGAGLVLERVLNTESPNLMDTAALLLIITACLILAFTEIAYLRDSFDSSGSYRMNTVFKFYYQAWTLLSLAAAYGVWRGWDVLRRYLPAVSVGLLLLVVAAGIAGAAVYTVLAPTASIQPDYGAVSLDGMAWLESQHPGDYAAIAWLRRHVRGSPVELEAVGGDYQYFARISTFSGLPTVMGWAGHEDQWRPGDSRVATRTTAVQTIYTTPSVSAAEHLLRAYRVRYVIVGEPERTAYGVAGLSKFSRFMRVAFHHSGTTIYTW